MRASSLAFALACAIALPCGLALTGYHKANDPATFVFYCGLFGIGAALGLTIMGIMDYGDYRAHREMNFDERRAALDRHAAPPYATREEPDGREEPPVDPKTQAKSVAIETFLRAGEKAGGFSEGKLAGCVGSDHGPWLRHFYISPAGGEWLRDAGGKTGTVWNYERTLDAALRELRAGVFPLPPGPVPDVHPLPDSAAQRRTSQKGEKRTITGMRAD